MIYALIIGMCIATLITRVLPVFIVNKITIPSFLQTFLSYVPYAALGVLIFPGVLNTIPNQPLIGLYAGIFACVLAYFKTPIYGVVFLTIGFVYIIL